MEYNYKELVSQSYQAMDEGRIEDFKTYFADNLVWNEAFGFPYGGVYQGIDAVIENVHSRLGTEWTNYKASPENYIVSGNDVVVYGKYSGSYKVTGKAFQADFAHFYHFNEKGKINHFIQVVDSALVKESMINK